MLCAFSSFWNDGNHVFDLREIRPVFGTAGRGRPHEEPQAPPRLTLSRVRDPAPVPGRLEGVAGAEASGHLEDPLPGVCAAEHHVRGARPARELETLRREVDADDALRSLQTRPRDRPETHHAGA